MSNVTNHNTVIFKRADARELALVLSSIYIILPPA